MKENFDKQNLVTVYSSNNYALLQVAKSILSNYKIKFYTTGENLNTMEQPVFSAEIKVFEKDEAEAKELLKELVQTHHEPTSEFDKKMLSASGYWIIGLLILFVIIMIIIFSMIK